jgi:hypothetical protein
MGSYEKHHGYIFYIACIMFALVASLIDTKQRSRLMSLSIVSASIVAIISLGEYLMLSPLLSSDTLTPWSSIRTISTLGNANYVAGYLLMHIPLVSRFSRNIRYL